MRCIWIAPAALVVAAMAQAGELQVSALKARPGSRCERAADGAVRVEMDGTYSWPGVSLCPAEGTTWDLSADGAVEVVVSNMSAQAELIHATVLGAGFGLDKSPARSALTPPGAVRTISVQIADAPWVTDRPVALPGMNGTVGSLDAVLKFDRTRSVDVYLTHGKSPRKAAFAVLGVRTAFAARQPKVLPAGTFFPFVDRYGQFRHDEWPGKIHSDAELTSARRPADGEAELQKMPEPVVPVAHALGAVGPRLKATGFYRTEKVAGKWWLVDPEGHLFYSVGVDCIYPGNSSVVDDRRNWFEWLPKAGAPDCDGLWYDRESRHLLFNFIEANLVRKYGKGWRPHFDEMVHRRFRAWGVNTLGNWSGARASRAGRFPYVGTVHPSSDTRLKTQAKPEGVYVPDVWSEQFVRDVDARLAKLAEKVRDDPWCVGVYVDNELAWHQVDNAEEVAEKYFSVVAAAMKRHLPNHLYLGCRFAWGGPEVWRVASRHCDVVSFNFYERMPTHDLPEGSVDKPLIVGEFHFGAKDRGMFIGGCSVAFDQAERARCFTDYAHACIDHPRILGCHWFQYQDQPLTGRPDGENFNDGFVSVCDVPYPEMVEACRTMTATMYRRRSERK